MFKGVIKNYFLFLKTIVLIIKKTNDKKGEISRINSVRKGYIEFILAYQKFYKVITVKNKVNKSLIFHKTNFNYSNSLQQFLTL